MLFGGLLTEGPGWRWVLFINVPFSAVALVGAFAPAQARADRAGRLANFDALGAFLVTGGMLLLVYALVKAPDVGWGATRTIAELAGSRRCSWRASSLNELRVRNPLVPLSILRSRGSPPPTPPRCWPSPASCRCSSSSRSTCRRVLGYSPIQTGIAYLPLTGGFIIAAGISLAAVRAHRHQAGHRRSAP